MRRNGEVLRGRMGQLFRDGGANFFHKGVNDRWRGVFRPDDLALYDARLAELPRDWRALAYGWRAHHGTPAA